MSSGSTSDTFATLARCFSRSDVTHSHIIDLQPTLVAYVHRHNKGDEHTSTRLQDELRTIYKSHVESYPEKLGPFVTVLRIVQPSMGGGSNAVEWFTKAIRPFVGQLGSRKDELRDAHDFTVESMTYVEDAQDAQEKAKSSTTVVHAVLKECIALSRLPEDGETIKAPQEQNSALAQLQSMIVSFGRKHPKDLFQAIDGHLLDPDSRFQALRILAYWLQQQHPHLDLVTDTSLVEHLLVCLMNDRSTAVVSAALQCLIMLLPHIPATVSTQLPRLFLIYSRCLCWERFSSSSSRAQKDHVTDDRIRRNSDPETVEPISIDPTWKVLESVPGTSDTLAPELLNYFTYLYGLYPLNFVNYIRKPRKYLKNIDFPGAERFDLDGSVIRSRTEQYQRAHLLHPNFFGTTAEEELSDNRWLKAEPAEVVAECLGLYSGEQTIPFSPGPPPSSKLPALPTLAGSVASSQLSPPMAGIMSKEASLDPAAGILTAISSDHLAKSTLPPVSDQIQTSTTDTETRPSTSGSITSDTLTAFGDASPQPLTGGPIKQSSKPESSDAAFLQRELMFLRHEMNFERYLKQQHMAAIGQLKRERIKAVTIEAETATLINANRALQKKLGDANKVNERMQRETQARRTHIRQSEEQFTAKIRSLRAGLVNQEALEASLNRAREDCDRLRQLLVESESREFRMQQEVDASREKIRDLDSAKKEVTELQAKLQSQEDQREQSQEANVEHDVLQTDLDAMRSMVLIRNQQRETSDKAFQAKIADLEQRLASASLSNDTQEQKAEPADVTDLRERLADAQKKQLSIKRSYARVLQDLTELKIRYEELLFSTGLMMPDGPAPAVQVPSYQILPGQYTYTDLPSATARYAASGLPQIPPTSTSGQRSRRGSSTIPSNGQSFPPNRPVRPEVYEEKLVNASPFSRSEGTTFNGDLSTHTKPRASIAGSHTRLGSFDSSGGSRSFKGLRQDSSAFSVSSEEMDSVDGQGKKTKSRVRMFGRGSVHGSHAKDKTKDKPIKTTGIRGLKGFL